MSLISSDALLHFHVTLTYSNTSIIRDIKQLYKTHPVRVFAAAKTIIVCILIDIGVFRKCFI